MLVVATLLSSLALAGSPCTHSQLHLHVGRADGAAGTFFRPLTFVNRSGRSCTLLGYPGVSSVDRRHRQIGSPATRDRDFPVRRVTLPAHGGTATAFYAQLDTGVLARRRCRPVRAWGLRVFAPGQTHAFLVRRRHEACARRDAGDSHVRPVFRGRKSA